MRKQVPGMCLRQRTDYDSFCKEIFNENVKNKILSCQYSSQFHTVMCYWLMRSLSDWSALMLWKKRVTQIHSTHVCMCVCLLHLLIMYLETSIKRFRVFQLPTSFPTRPTWEWAVPVQDPEDVSPWFVPPDPRPPWGFLLCLWSSADSFSFSCTGDAQEYVGFTQRFSGKALALHFNGHASSPPYHAYAFPRRPSLASVFM